MSENEPPFDCGPEAKTPLLLDGVSNDDLTSDFLRRVHEAAESEGLPLQSISVETR